MIQAAGLSGIPFAGHEASAEANDSCIASSARSKEPEIRIRLATIRPDSCRKTDSTVERMSSIRSRDVTGDRAGFRARGQAAHRADFDATFSALARRRDFGPPFDGFVQVLAFHDVVTREMLLGFGERSVGHQSFSVLHPDRSGGAGGSQRFGADQYA